MNNLKTSDKGLALIRKFEGLRLKAYKDSVGVWTIGYGHTGHDVKEGLVITDTRAVTLLRADVKVAEYAVNHMVTGPLEQCQFDALVSFTFNLGSQSLRSSTLLKLLNSHDAIGAAEQFLRWNRADGKILTGLTLRRADERKLFLGQEV